MQVIGWQRRVLRVMREAALLAPARQLEPVVEHPHDGTIITDQPNVMWGTDATAAITLLEGAATVFAAIDHCTAKCVGIHAARHGDRFEALGPLRQAFGTTSVASRRRPPTASRCDTTTAVSI